MPHTFTADDVRAKLTAERESDEPDAVMAVLADPAVDHRFEEP